MPYASADKKLISWFHTFGALSFPISIKSTTSIGTEMILAREI
jgi:hypothetical protein